MSHRDTARRALIHAQLELENTDEAAITEAIMWVVRAHFALLDLKGTHLPYGERKPAETSRPTVQEVPPLAAPCSLRTSTPKETT